MADDPVGITYPELSTLELLMKLLAPMDRQTVDRLLRFAQDWNKTRPASAE